MAGIEAGFINILIVPKLVADFASKLGLDLQKKVGDAGDKAGDSLATNLSKSFSKAGPALTKSITAPIVAGFTAAITAGLKVDEAYDIIRAQTGKLTDDLKGSFNSVASNVVGSFTDIAGVFSQLQVKLDISGKPLEDLTTAVIQLKKVTGEGVDVESFAGVLQAYNIAAADGTKLLDGFLRATQASGISINELIKTLKSQASTFKQLGLDIFQATALVSNFEEKGINAQLVLVSLRRAALKGAKGNNELTKSQEELSGTYDAIAKNQEDILVATQKLNELRQQGGIDTVFAAKEEERLSKLRNDQSAKLLELQSAEQKLAELRANPKTVASAITAQEARVLSLTNSVRELQDEIAKGPEIKISGGAKDSALLQAEINLKRLDEERVKLEESAKQSEANIEKSLANASQSSGKLVLESVAQITQLLQAGDRAAAEALATSEFGRGALEVIRAVEQGAFNIQDLAKDIQFGSETIATAYAAVLDFPDQLALFRNRFGLAIAPIGTELFPVLETAINTFLPFLITLVDLFSKLPEPVQNGIIALAGFAALVGPLLTGLAPLITAFQALALAQGAAALGAQILRGALIGLGIGALIALLVVVVLNWDKIKEAGAKAFEVIKEKFGQAYEFIKENWKLLLALLTGPIGAVTVLIVKNWDRIKQGFKVLVDGIKLIASTLLKIIVTPFETSAKITITVLTGLYNFFKTFITNTINLFKSLGTSLANAFANIAKLPGIAQLTSIVSGIGKVTGLFGGARADGGPISANKAYLVGERGPEVVIPNKSGYVLPNSILSGMAGNNGTASYVVNVYNPVAETSSASIPAALRRANVLRSRE